MTATPIRTQSISNDNKLCAAVSVFRNLYDTKTDVRDNLAVFISYIITKNSLFHFTAYEIKCQLFEEFYFDIPEAIIKTILKKRLKYSLSNGIFQRQSESILLDTSSLSSELDIAINKNELIISSLIEFAERHTNSQLNSDEQAGISETFYSFLMDNTTTSKYVNIVSAYVISITSDTEKQKTLSTIKEGIILYEGIKYTDNLNEIALWKKHLNIFCDVDILFSLYGLNGKTFKDFASDAIDLVIETNQKVKNHNQISLLYFPKTKNEMDRYFEKAEDILNNKEPLDPSKTAMTVILNGCESPSDIIKKKTAFYSFLKSKNILEFDNIENFYSIKDNEQYVLSSAEAISMLQDRFNITKDYANDCFDYINYINGLRHGKNGTYLEEAEYIFLTSNKKILFLANMLKIEGSFEVSRAVTTDYIVNKLWFKLNKGFGEKNISSFNIITKAQMLLSSQINSKISERYDECIDELKSGKKNVEEIKDYLLVLKKESKNPEDITEEICDDSLEFLISENSITEKLEYINTLEERYDRSEEKYNKTVEELCVSQKTNSEKDKQIQELKNKVNELEKEKEKQQEAERAAEEQRKTLELQEKQKKTRIIRTLCFFIVCLIVLVTITYLGFVLESNALTITGWIFGLLSLLISLISLFGINIKDWIKQNKK